MEAKIRWRSLWPLWFRGFIYLGNRRPPGEQKCYCPSGKDQEGFYGSYIHPGTMLLCILHSPQDYISLANMKTLVKEGYIHLTTMETIRLRKLNLSRNHKDLLSKYTIFTWSYGGKSAMNMLKAFLFNRNHGDLISINGSCFYLRSMGTIWP